MKREFNLVISELVESIATFDYYVDFTKIYKNIDSIKIELNILNSLVGSKDIKKDFITLLSKYPEVLKCIPILMACRKNVVAQDEYIQLTTYDFINPNKSLDEYAYFMEKTGLFNLISNRIVSNLIDYSTGVEVGLDSNGRKNRGGDLMEDLVESYIIKAGYVKNITYFKELKLSEIEKMWNIDLSKISNNKKTEKRFDFVIKTANCIYGIETNFYTQGGSKLNETARSYKNLSLESKEIQGFKFVWFTDGLGWKSAKNNLLETFMVLDDLYTIKDLENNIIEKNIK